MNYDKMYEEFQKTQIQMMESWEKWILGITSSNEREELEASFVLWKEILFPGVSEEDDSDLLAYFWKQYCEDPHDPKLDEMMESLWKLAALQAEETQLMGRVSGSLKTFIRQIFDEAKKNKVAWDSQPDYVKAHEQFREYGIKWQENYQRQMSSNNSPMSATEKMYLDLQRELVELLMDYEEKILAYLFTLRIFIMDERESAWEFLETMDEPNFESFSKNWSRILEEKLQEFHEQPEVAHLDGEIKELSDALIQTQTMLMENRANYLPFVNKRSYDELKSRVEEVEEAMEQAVVRKDLESIVGEVKMVKKNLRKNASDTVHIETKLQNFVLRDEVEGMLRQKDRSEELLTAQHILREDLALTQRALDQSQRALLEMQEEIESLKASLAILKKNQKDK